MSVNALKTTFLLSMLDPAQMCSQEPLMMAVKSSGKAVLSYTTQRSLNLEGKTVTTKLLFNSYRVCFHGHEYDE